MLRNTRYLVAFSSTVFVAGVLLGTVLQPVPALRAQSDKRVFEIRTYTANEGKLDALQARFRNHTTRLFEKHGITNVGYWHPLDAPLSQNTLVYIISYPNREAAKKNWQGFQDDPTWQKVRSDSEVNGRLVAKVESIFMEATDYSPIK